MKRNFQNFYQENIDYLTSFSHEIDKIKRSKNSFKEDIDELSFFLNMYNKLNESFDLMVTRVWYILIRNNRNYMLKCKCFSLFINLKMNIKI